MMRWFFAMAWLACMGTESVDSTDEAPSSDLPNALAETTTGLVQGESVDGVAVFRGIPYAAPPVGDLRWAPPQPADAWDDVREAREFAPACPQLQLAPLIPAPENQSEDCLAANVWTPAKTVSDALPVMVWIHGGGFIIGEGSPSTVTGDGATLARDGSVVVVTFNYRLGQLGFLAHAVLSEESSDGVSGNYGLRDQIQLLSWVRDNAAAFGGDPDNVTIFGESAGGVSVCAMIASPLAAGLFHRAIMQSGPCVARMPSLREGAGFYQAGEVVGDRFAEGLGCKGDDVLSCMRKSSVDDVLAAEPAGIEWGPLSEGQAGQNYGPMVDGLVLEASVREVVEAGAPSVVPVIAGTNADEGALFTGAFDKIKTIEDYRSLIKTVFGDDAQDVLKLYPVKKASDIEPTAAQLLGDVAFVCPTRESLKALATGAPAYQYHFTHVGAIGAAFGWGVYHGADVAYVFGDFDDRFTWSEEDYALSEQIIGVWTRFAATGDPSGDDLDWPAYDVKTDQHLVLAVPTSMGTDLRQAECDLLADIQLF